MNQLNEFPSFSTDGVQEECSANKPSYPVYPIDPIDPEQPIPDPASLPSNCAELYAHGVNESGVYYLNLADASCKAPVIVKVYCDMETDGGGWTVSFYWKKIGLKLTKHYFDHFQVFQRRTDGNEPFSRNWETYKRGFGNPSKEFWIGEQKVHMLKNKSPFLLQLLIQ